MAELDRFRVPMRRMPKLLLALVLLVFQAQALAAQALGCLHEDVGGAVSACPHQGPAPAADGAAGGGPAAQPLDCVKCALALGLTVVSAAGPGVPPRAYRPPAAASPGVHFYLRAPEEPLRPPI